MYVSQVIATLQLFSPDAEVWVSDGFSGVFNVSIVEQENGNAVMVYQRTVPPSPYPVPVPPVTIPANLADVPAHKSFVTDTSKAK